MSQQNGHSPSFKRPAEVIRIRRKRARSVVGELSSSADSLSQCRPSTVRLQGSLGRSEESSRQHSTAAGTTCRNPFANVQNTSGPNKKLKVCDETPNSDAEDGYKLTQWKAMAEAEDQRLDRFGDFNERFTLAETLDVSSKRSELTDAPSGCTEYPADWSLKTRLLFTSPNSLSWAEKPKAHEEALGLHQHCRAHISTLPLSVTEPGSCSELRCAFQQSLVYWQHPSLPWLSLFPRINAEKSFSGQNTPWAQDTVLQQCLMKEWSVSLSSLYGLLKSTLCPYFYLCSYQFTVLFRAAGVGGSSNITALISPTTRGLREALNAEGIEYSLPLLEKRKRSREWQPEERQEVEAEEIFSSDPAEDQKNYGEDEDGCFSWLKEIGVHDKIKKPDGITLLLQKESHTVSLDHKPESVAFVEGSHTFTLINFLINFKYIVAAAGSQAGLPPTLLAPVAFKGATMHMLKGRSVNAKSHIGSTYQNISSLEITGPVLPSSLHAITTLLQLAQKGNFSAALYTHMPTAVMNVNASEMQSTVGSVDLSACGLHPACIKELQKPPTLDKTALTHLELSNYSYTWKN